MYHDESAIRPGPRHEPKAQRLHLSAVGHIGRSALSQLDDLLVPSSGPNWRSMRLALDLSDATFLDSAGISALLTLREQMRQVGGNVVLCGVPARLHRMFEIIGMSGFIPITHTVQEAQESVLT